MIKVDWSKAPDWATRAGLLDASTLSGGLDNGLIWYNADQFCRMSDERQKPFPWGNLAESDGAHHNPRESQVRFWEARPKLWGGEGLPPVGTVCELRATGNSSWAKGVVVFSEMNVLVWRWGRQDDSLCASYAHSVEARPIRTPEQIAAEEQAKAVHQMGLDAGFSGSVQEFAERLYQAGYRKQVAP